MKLKKYTKIILTSVFIFLLSFGFNIKTNASNIVPINETNFPDSGFRQYVLSHYDTDGDDNLSETEINNATDFHIAYNSSLNNFQGIEYLTELRSLIIDTGFIDHLDISENIKLENIEIKFSMINYIDLTKNINLKNVELTGLFMMHSVDLSNCHMLETFTSEEGYLNDIKLPSHPLQAVNIEKQLYHVNMKWDDTNSQYEAPVTPLNNLTSNNPDFTYANDFISTKKIYCRNLVTVSTNDPSITFPLEFVPNYIHVFDKNPYSDKHKDIITYVDISNNDIIDWIRDRWGFSPQEVVFEPSTGKLIIKKAYLDTIAENSKVELPLSHSNIIRFKAIKTAYTPNEDKNNSGVSNNDKQKENQNNQKSPNKAKSKKKIEKTTHVVKTTVKSISKTTSIKPLAKSPKTGDEVSIIPFAISASVALILILTVFIKKRRKNK
jgi:LPXTG-motif cell wall-anchored protein